MGDHEEEEVSTAVETFIELEGASKTASTLTEVSICPCEHYYHIKNQ